MDECWHLEHPAKEQLDSKIISRPIALAHPVLVIRRDDEIKIVQFYFRQIKDMNRQAGDDDVGSVFTPRTLNASGIGGVLGTAFGVPLALTTYSSSASAALTSYTKGNQTVFGGLVEFGYGVQQSQFNTPILAFTFTRNYFSITVDFASGSFGVSTGGYFPTMFRRARVAFQFLVTLGTVADGLYMVLLNFFTSEDADLTHQDPSTNAFGFGSSSFSLAVPVQINGGAHQGTVIGTVDVDLTAWNDSSEAGRAGTFLHIAAASLAGSVTVASDLTNAATVTAVELP